MRDWRPAVRARLAGVRLSPTRESAIVEELAQHLEDRERELVANGHDSDEATGMVRAELDRAELLASRLATLREGRWEPPPVPGGRGRGVLHGAWQDVRQACRALLRDPLTTSVAVVTLALGIGLNTAMFGFMNALLFRPLPFPDAGRLVRVVRSTPQHRDASMSVADFLALRDNESRYGEFAAYRASTLALADGRHSEEWLEVSANLFDVLGVRPSRGRTFDASDATRAGGVALISDGMWRDRYGASEDVLGRLLRVEKASFAIVGVLPPSASDYRLFGRAGVFTLLPMEAGRGAPVTVIGRRAAHLSAAEADGILAALGGHVTTSRGPSASADGTRAEWTGEALPHTKTGPTGRALLAMLLGLSGCVLLIACSNLANLLLARTMDRRSEIAVRSALGGSRLHLIRAVGLESVLLAVCGGAGAWAVAGWTTAWLQSLHVDGGAPSIALDWRVLLFAAGVSGAAVVGCGAAPVLFAARIAPADTLKGSGRGIAGARGLIRLRNAAIAAQFALALTLLAGAGHFLRGTAAVLSQHHGWRADDVVQADLVLPAERYASATDISAFHERVVQEVAGVPGVAAVSVSYGLPYLGLRGMGRYAGDEGAAARDSVMAELNGVSPRYFDVTDTPLRAGRHFDDTDTATSRPVVIVSETMARRLFPGRSAIGRRVADVSTDTRTWMDVVGVVADVQSIDIARDPPPYQLYQPIAQDPRHGGILAARLAVDPSAAAFAAMRAAVARVDPDLELRRLTTVETRMQDVTSSLHLVTRLLTGFALLGLLLAGVGLYGVVARSVAQRRDEIGIRMAMGARTGDVLGLVVGSASRLVAAGAVVGIAGAFAMSRLLATVLPRLDTRPGAITVSGVLLLAAVALAASAGPARRASRIDPMAALRSE